jgi:predicted ATPase
MIKSVLLDNFLSFSQYADEIDLRPLNIIIGGNASGKSNFIEAFNILQNAPLSIQNPITERGGIKDWIYNGEGALEDVILDFNVNINIPNSTFKEIKYTFIFGEKDDYFKLLGEKVTGLGDLPVELYNFDIGNSDESFICCRDGEKMIKESIEHIDKSRSILTQIADRKRFPEIAHLSNEVKKIKIYRDWGFGKANISRESHKVQMFNDYLSSDFSNLALVVNELRRDYETKTRILRELQNFCYDIVDFDLRLSGSWAELFFHEKGARFPVPASFLSDGIIHYLCLLAILLHPSPPPLVIIEEPELGLHPDILSSLPDLFKEASKKCQLIITTHSNSIVDDFTDSPEAIMVAERTAFGSRINRLNEQQLKPWLEKYRLGYLWTRGDIGGNLW